MVVMILENASPSLRGHLTRWLIEPQSGIFVGKISALVRDKLWELCEDKVRIGGTVQIWSDANEQGFSIRTHGDTARQLVNIEGLWLVRKPLKGKKAEKIARTLQPKIEL